jgi:hypothetical protein
LYVSDSYQSYVYTFYYPEGNRLDILTQGISSPQGECVDKHGNVWVANMASSNVAAFAPDAKKPKKMLNDPDTEPAGCAIDQTSGDLAVTSLDDPSGQGSVAVYFHAQGAPTQYTDPTIYRVFFCAYDDKGNLFVDGLTRTGFGLAELRKGSDQLIDLAVSHPIYFPGGVQWDGKYLAIGDQDTNDVYQFNIEGGKATLQGTTRMKDAGDVVQFWLFRKDPKARASRLIGPDPYNHDVEVYAYPGGGKPTEVYAGAYMYEPIGAAVTPAEAP